MYALCDVNSMYASCEKVFDPAIRNKPVVVLTNNDGCICAACHIAKKMGVGKKFVPYFQVRKELERAGTVVRSSNYELYADLSNRMMDTCVRFAPDAHIYSIDECFLSYGNYIPPEGWGAHGAKIRRAVWREVRLPIGVGIGPTPTLAKAASHAAKQLSGFNGVAVLDNEKVRRRVLSQMRVSDIWGIGRRMEVRLNDMNITTALQFANAPASLIRKNLSISAEETLHELNGELRLSWDQVRAPKKEIYSTRSFGQRVSDKTSLQHALASHAEIACAKLRRQGSLAKAVVIFAGNSPHDRSGYIRKSVFHHFPVATSDTRLVMEACTLAMTRLFVPGVRYYRCGIGLVDLCASTSLQHDLFTPSLDNPELMQCMDAINHRFGRNMAQLAGKGISQKFAMRRAFLSPQYTTQWQDIPKIHCI